MSRATLKPARGTRGTTIDPWLNAMFEPADKKIWLAAGLGEDDVALAKQCNLVGITPKDLQTPLPDGSMPARRLRGGESVTRVKSRIDEARGLTR